MIARRFTGLVVAVFMVLAGGVGQALGAGEADALDAGIAAYRAEDCVAVHGTSTDGAFAQSDECAFFPFARAAASIGEGCYAMAVWSALSKFAVVLGAVGVHQNASPMFIVVSFPGASDGRQVLKQYNPKIGIMSRTNSCP